ncbi:MAG: hypothetical protein AAFP90_19930 [Planctomycetota bacterium]
MKQRCHVFQQDDSRFHLANDSHEFKEKPGSFSMQSSTRTGITNVLTGEPACDKVNGFGVGLRPGFDVVMSSNGWPMFGEHAPRVGINFDLPFALHPGPFQSKIDPADSRKQ